MATSLLATAVFAGLAAAQGDARYVDPPPASVYNARIAPWPSPKPAPLPAPVMSAPPTKTLYYKKEPGAGVSPAGAVKPAAAPTPLPPPGPPPDRKRAEPSSQPAKNYPSTPVDMELPKSEPGSKLFRLDAEPEMQARINAERREENKRLLAEGKKTLEVLSMPAEDPVSRDRYAPRSYAQALCTVEPNFVCYGRLYFEQKNFERYGWSLGPLTPLVSTTKYIGDFVTFPYKFAAFPFQRYDSGAGMCLPGDPVPLYLYPPQISYTGLVAETSCILILIAILP